MILIERNVREMLLRVSIFGVEVTYKDTFHFHHIQTPCRTTKTFHCIHLFFLCEVLVLSKQPLVCLKAM